LLICLALVFLAAIGSLLCVISADLRPLTYSFFS